MMVGRLVWFGLGAGFSVWAAGKVRGYLRKASPEALGHRLAGSAAALTESAHEFADRVRAAMAEREAELRELHQLGRRDALGLPPSE